MIPFSFDRYTESDVVSAKLVEIDPIKMGKKNFSTKDCSDNERCIPPVL